MPAIENLLKRMGFVRLSRFGLVLTPEGRIMSMRPAVLDDGTGGRIVGWLDRDLAAAELQPWEPARPAPRQAVAGRVATPLRISPPVPVRVITPLAPAPAPAPVTEVAAAAEVDEDEWEWEIALARARVAAEEVEAARPPAPVRPSRPSRRSRLDTVPPPVVAVLPPEVSIPPKFVEAKTMPLATVAARPSSVHDEVTAEWPKTEPLTSLDFEDHTSPTVVRVVSLTPPTVLPARMPKATPAPMPATPAVSIPAPIGRAHPRAPSPTTVIPVPKLPRVTTQQLAPVVRRFPKATPVTALGLPPPPVVRPVTAPIDEEKTSPGTLPAPARMIALPRIPSIVKR